MPQNPVNTTLFVSQLKAGSNIALDPSGGTGVVTISTTAPAVRYLPLTAVKTDAGLPLAIATAATTLPGIARTAGTNLYLTGAATSDTTPATTKMLWEFDLPETYVAEADIPVVVNCVVPIATDVTAASTTMTVAAYTEVNGVEAALTVSAAQEIPLTTAGNLTFTITGSASGLKPGSHVVLELTMLVTTTTGGASSGQVNSVGFSA